MVLLSDETTQRKPIRTFSDIMRARRQREAKKARRSAAATFIKEFFFIVFMFAFLFYIVGGVSR
jgi:hypothetical protein